MLALAKAGLDDSIGSVTVKNSALCSGGMAAVGHEDQFPVSGTSARYGFTKETITGTRGNDEDAPLAVPQSLNRVGVAGPRG